MKEFSFAVNPVIVSGPGCIASLSRWVEKFRASRYLVVSDAALSKAGIPQRVQKHLPASTLFDSIDGEPTFEFVQAGLKALRDSKAELILAVGGGSAIDTAKLTSILATNKGSLLDFAKDWSSVKKPGVPVVTIPTTVGSGSEVTRGAVFKDPAKHTKLVVLSEHLAARITFLDPTLLDTLPSAVTASTGADALTQAIEGILSTGASPFTDALHLHAIRLIKGSFIPAVRSSKDTEAMGVMQQAAAMVGAGLAYSGVGAAHAVANTLGGHYRIPHGVACAIMLSPVIRYNAPIAPDRCRPIAEALGIAVSGMSNDKVANEVIHQAEWLLEEAHVSWKLREFDVPESDIPSVAAEAASHSDMASNPRQPTVAEVAEMIRSVW